MLTLSQKGGWLKYKSPEIPWEDHRVSSHSHLTGNERDVFFFGFLVCFHFIDELSTSEM